MPTLPQRLRASTFARRAADPDIQDLLDEAATALEARLPHDSRYSVADIRKIAADRGPHFDGCARACLVWAADTLAAADVVIRELREQGIGDSR